jgi:hypothetical protein
MKLDKWMNRITKERTIIGRRIQIERPGRKSFWSSDGNEGKKGGFLLARKKKPPMELNKTIFREMGIEK